MRCWHGYLCGARCKRFAYESADATATLSSLVSLKSKLVWPFWCQLTQVVLEQRPLNGYLFVCKVIVSGSTTNWKDSGVCRSLLSSITYCQQCILLLHYRIVSNVNLSCATSVVSGFGECGVHFLGSQGTPSVIAQSSLQWFDAVNLATRKASSM